MPPLRGRVVRLAHIAHQERIGSGADQAAVDRRSAVGLRLLAPVIHGVLDHREVTLHVDADHRVPHVFRHLHDHAVAGEARVVHHDVQIAEGVDRAAHDALGVVPVRDVSERSHGLAAEGFDFLDYSLGGLFARAAAIGLGPKVIDDDARPVSRQLQRFDAPQSLAGAGDDSDLSVQNSHDLLLSPTAPRCAQ